MTAPTMTAPTLAPPPKRRRLKRAERERMIVEAAITFFAEVGFEGQTRELAQRIGVTQPLIFQYFPSKDELIERVYHETFLGRWKPGWEALLDDRSQTLRARLTTFYIEYMRILTHDSVRIFMYSGLKGGEFNRRYLGMVRDRLLVRVCREVRAERGLPDLESVPLSAHEIESAWALHGSFFYVGIRRWIYGLDTPDDVESMVEKRIGAFLDGAGAEAERVIAGDRPAGPQPRRNGGNPAKPSPP